jgi:CDP-diacylglycerol--serine O-phosphatidyltransferase
MVLPPQPIQFQPKAFSAMTTFWLIAIVLLMLALERIIVTSVTRHPRGRAWVRRIPFLHPNAISLMRIPMGLVSVWLASRGNWPGAVLWFAFWMITDLSDGTIARNCDLTTETGKWLDPLSDKCMYFPPLIYFSVGEDILTPINPWLVGAFLVIDTLGQASRLISQKKAANSFGKAKTALTTILLSAIALNQVSPIWLITPQFVTALTIACVILAFFSCYCKVIPDIWYANSFTLANFLCGIAAIVLAWQQKFILSLVLIFFGQFFDLFDGRMARKYGSTKRGPVFDDLADATSFGLAVGCIIYFCLANHEELVPSWAAMIIAGLFVVCLIYRLYRFLHPTKDMPSGIFQGLPSPAGAMLAGSAVLIAQDLEHPAFGLAAAAVVILASMLMISNIPYRHFARSIWPAIPRGTKLLLCILILILTLITITHKIYRSSFVWLCLVSTIVYTIAGIDRRKPDEIAAQERLLADNGDNGDDETSENSEQRP